MGFDLNDTWTNEDILEVAKRQKQILWMILLSLAAMFSPVTIIAAGVIQAYFIYKLGEAVRASAPIVYVILSFIPLAGLVGLLVLNSKATKRLQASGVRVGLMGARSVDLDPLRSGV
jgi:hypothetical protein